MERDRDALAVSQDLRDGQRCDHLHLIILH
jgi:hypothetical protein